MMKRLIAVVLSVALACAFVPTAGAVGNNTEAAQALYELGLFQGVGTNADGTPDFALDRVPTRAEAVTMLVRLLGKDEEAKAGTWTTPFTDVADWAKPYVGYAYANGLTTGTSETTFGGDTTINATQYLTFVLRALGYTSGTDFQWDKAWEKSDEIKLTNGEYNASTPSFIRGDIAKISESALSIKGKGGKDTLLTTLVSTKAVSEKAADNYLHPPVAVEAVTLSKSSLELEIGKSETITATVAPDNATDKTVTWKSSNTSVATVDNGTIKAVGTGTATITATSANGKSASCLLSVKDIWYSQGAYRIGTDLPAGDYYALKTSGSKGYYCIYPNTAKEDIEQNNNFGRNDFFRVKDGQYLELSKCRITETKNVPESIVSPNEQGVYTEGVYRVGIDIPAGEYKFVGERGNDNSGYYCAYSDISKEDIDDNDFFHGSTYYTVKRGQYLEVASGTSCMLVSAMGNQQTGDDNEKETPEGIPSGIKYYAGTTVPTFPSVIACYGTRTPGEVARKSGVVDVDQYEYNTAKGAEVELYKEKLESVFGFTKNETKGYYVAPNKDMVMISFVEVPNFKSYLLITVDTPPRS